MEGGLKQEVLHKQDLRADGAEGLFAKGECEGPKVSRGDLERWRGSGERERTKHIMAKYRPPTLTVESEMTYMTIAGEREGWEDISRTQSRGLVRARTDRC